MNLPNTSPQPQTLMETPLEYAVVTSNAEIEKIDYIWREAVRRNQWILTQGGERVKAFIRKHAGPMCSCYDGDTYKQPKGDCLICFGTGFVGGYEGPYDVVFAPDDADRSVEQQQNGSTVTHSYEVWTGPSPLFTQRDFIVKLNGERYSIGGVRMPTNRGMVLQQHFNIGHIDEGDIRYRVPIDNPHRFALDQLQPQIPPEMFPAEITDKPNIPDERELKGRNAVWENITY